MRGSKWLLSIACLVALPAKGQFTLEADTNRIQWGERVTLTATWMTSLAALKATPETTWSAWQDSLETSLDVLKTHPLDTAAAPPSSGMEVMVSQSWEATSFDSGFVAIAPLALGAMASNALTIQVLTPDLDAEAQPRPPADIVGVHLTWWDRLKAWAPWMLGLALLGGLVWLAARFLPNLRARRHESPLPEVVVDGRPPHEIALGILAPLLADEGWKRGLDKDVHVEASLAVRHYLEGRFGLQAAERTTSELKVILPTSSVPASWHPRLVASFEAGDMVKFAKGSIPDLAHREILKGYIDFVESTIPASNE